MELSHSCYCLLLCFTPTCLPRKMLIALSLILSCNVIWSFIYLSYLSVCVHVQRTAVTVRNSVWMNPLPPEFSTSGNFPMKCQRLKSLLLGCLSERWPTYWCWRGRTRYTITKLYNILGWRWVKSCNHIYVQLNNNLRTGTHCSGGDLLIYCVLPGVSGVGYRGSCHYYGELLHSCHTTGLKCIIVHSCCTLLIGYFLVVRATNWMVCCMDLTLFRSETLLSSSSTPTIRNWKQTQLLTRYTHRYICTLNTTLQPKQG